MAGNIQELSVVPISKPKETVSGEQWETVGKKKDTIKVVAKDTTKVVAKDTKAQAPTIPAAKIQAPNAAKVEAHVAPKVAEENEWETVGSKKKDAKVAAVAKPALVVAPKVLIVSLKMQLPFRLVPRVIHILPNFC